MNYLKNLLPIILIIFSLSQAMAQQNQTKTTKMKTYLIEREIPGAGDLTQVELQGASQKSCDVLKEMGTGIEWLNSYVLDNKLYCVYKAENEELIRTHAEKGGFPCNKIMEIKTQISPKTAELATN